MSRSRATGLHALKSLGPEKRISRENTRNLSRDNEKGCPPSSQPGHLRPGGAICFPMRKIQAGFISRADLNFGKDFAYIPFPYPKGGCEKGDAPPFRAGGQHNDIA